MNFACVDGIDYIYPKKELGISLIYMEGIELGWRLWGQQGAHNRAVPGSNPGGPTRHLFFMGKNFAGARQSDPKVDFAIRGITAICRLGLAKLAPSLQEGVAFQTGKPQKT